MPASPDRPETTRRVLLRGAALTPVAALLAGCDSSGQPGSTRSGSPSATGSSATSPSATGPSATASRTPTPTATPSTQPSTQPSAAPAGPLVPRPERPLATGLSVPWSIVFLPAGGALVSQRDTAQVVHVTPQGRVRRVGTVPGVVSNVDEGGEAGLLGLALHPRFATDPWVYAYHSTETDNRVVRMRYAGGRLGPPRLVLDGIRTSVHHNGGGLAFGPDGHLLVSTGDAERPDDAQDTSSLNGKVLRVTDRGRVPGGNPFRNPVWTYGHRNVEGLAFDPTGQLWASEFGDKARDELNRIDRGSNYGWPAVEGRDGAGGYHDPLATWRTDDGSPSGLAIAHGRAWLGALQGECVYSVVLRGAQAGRIRRHVPGHGRIRSVATAPDGSLWVGTSNRDGRATPRPGDDRLLRVPFAVRRTTG